MRLTVVQRFAISVIVIAALCLLVVYVTANKPWLGLSISAVSDDIVVREAVNGGPSRAIAAGSQIVSLSNGGSAEVVLKPSDLIEEPDTLDSYKSYNRFLERQQRLHSILSSGTIKIAIKPPGQTAVSPVAVAVADGRPLSSLPGTFWFQIICAVLIAVIGSWVAALRRGDGRAALFAVAGYGASVSIAAASIYSTRELALPGALFHFLSGANHGGAMVFAIFMIGLFTRYPVRLNSGWVFPAAAVVLSLWWLLNIFQFFSTIGQGFYLGVLAAMITIICLIAAQYRATRGDVPARKALLWLGVSVVVGAGAFSIVMAIPILAGRGAPLSQAYSFGFFPLIYLGVALGLTRYRLFELDRWAFGVLTYILAGLFFVVVDAVLISTMAFSVPASAGITALVIGLVYLPLRNYLTGRVFSARETDPYSLFQASAEIALQPSPEARSRRWEQALSEHFSPLETRVAIAETERPTIAEDGQALHIPRYPWSGPLILRHHMRGRRLFGEPHARVVERLAFLVSEAERNRESYDRGVREERRRIGRDLHDNVGAMLLSSLRAPNGMSSRELVRDALSDIREIVGGLSGSNEPLCNIVAQLRNETLERLHGIEVDWPLGNADEEAGALPYAVYRALTSAHREIVSNVLRHAGATKVVILTSVDGPWLRHSVENDIVADKVPPSGSRGGNGIVNLNQRTSELGGMFSFMQEERRAVSTMRLPIGTAATSGASSD